MKSFRNALLGSLLLLAGAVRAKEDEEVDDGERLIAMRTHVLYPPYVDQELQSNRWDFGADAIINTNKHVRLTQDRRSEMGWLWSRLPIKAENYEIEVEFNVNGKGHSLFGDGFAMWLTTDRAKPGPVFGSIDNFNGLGLFFDTYPNSRHTYSFPRATAMLGDGKTPYDHDHDNQANELAACSMDFRRRDTRTMLKLRYIKSKSLSLQLQVEKEGRWDDCFEAQNVELPAGDIYLGFSALTGDVSDAHDIISVSTNSIVFNSTLPVGAESQLYKSKKSRKSSSTGLSMFLFLLKAIGVLAFCAFAFSAYRTYNAQKRGKRF
ncbi:hypothetical protein FFLO_01351 [Filobasidium floriforme]|uniref:L-type lectin-like domain-containing protein n=1 Tax=Filobasidium floriforme TaxID=5210 RepID=A0A8K0JQ22_9TREE|nr:hypothetical protein FFLO_01351 [Filobasidium floriforme]